MTKEVTIAEAAAGRDTNPRYVSQNCDVEKIILVKTKFEELDHFVRTNLPLGRYQAMALTGIEEASMWAVKAESHKGVL